MSEADRLIAMLARSLEETLAVLAVLRDEELDHPSDHPCAMGGSIRDLLSHNVDHERMHAGQVYSARYDLRTMQSGEAARLMAETLRARADLMAALLGLPDEVIDARPSASGEQWTIREMVEHTLYWERHSIDDLARRKLAGRARPAASPELRALVDPLVGPLPDPSAPVAPYPAAVPGTMPAREPLVPQRPAVTAPANGRSHAERIAVSAPAAPEPDGAAVFYAPDAVYQARDGVTLAIDPERPHWIATNGSGASVLRLLDGRRTLAEVADELVVRHGASADAALGQVAAFVAALQSVEYVSAGPRRQPAYRGRAEAVDLGRLSDLYLFLTNDCNLRCTHCYVSSGDYVPPNELDAGEVAGAIDQALALGVERFYFTGGEPFMVKAIYDHVARVTAQADLVILTNGMLFTPANIAHLQRAQGPGRVTLQISLDGPTAELHDAIRGPGAFARTTAVIPHLLESGFPVVISTALTRHTLAHMPAMTRLVATLGVREHHILWMQEWGRALDHGPELLVPPAEVTRVMRALRAVAAETGVLIDNEHSLRLRLRGKRGRKTDLCSCGWDSLAVFSDGEVYPCVWLAGAPGVGCGSLRERSLERIWRESPVLADMRAVSVQNREGCSDCHLKFLCAGGSPCSSHFASLATRGRGDFRAAEPYCGTLMDLSHDGLWELALAGVDLADGRSGGYAPPRLLNAMAGAGAECLRPNTHALDRAFEVGHTHCVCVLEPETSAASDGAPDEETQPPPQRAQRSVKEQPPPLQAARERRAAGEGWGGGRGRAAPAGQPLPGAAGDPLAATASFDARGFACVELLVPLSRHVRALAPGQILKVTSDDPAARHDLEGWCRLTGHELAAAENGRGYRTFFIRRGPR